jgi:hypothetical protein
MAGKSIQKCCRPSAGYKDETLFSVFVQCGGPTWQRPPPSRKLTIFLALLFTTKKAAGLRPVISIQIAAGLGPVEKLANLPAYSRL